MSKTILYYTQVGLGDRPAAARVRGVAGYEGRPRLSPRGSRGQHAPREMPVFLNGTCKDISASAAISKRFRRPEILFFVDARSIFVYEAPLCKVIDIELQ